MSEETKSVTPTVEEALAELREMFPDADSLQVSVDAWCWKERGGGMQRDATILIGCNPAAPKFEGKDIPDCMAQVRAWKESNV